MELIVLNIESAAARAFLESEPSGSGTLANYINILTEQCKNFDLNQELDDKDVEDAIQHVLVALKKIIITDNPELEVKLSEMIDQAKH